MPIAPELLAPAGTLRNLHYALAYGADAVYAGLPRYSLRARNNDFDLAKVAAGIAATHAAGRRFYLACNLFARGSKLGTFVQDIAPVVALGPDALIMADPGLIMWVRERWPALPVHLSVQANTMNAAAVQFWTRQGIKRVILSRELSLEEIATIRQDCPDTELEVFVHGAICIAYSGRCLLSGYFNHRDANQGVCTNACRWEYRLGTVSPLAKATNSGRHPAADEVYLLEENERPGEYMPVFEDENGTYIMNAKDLCAVEHIGRLVDIGIDCLKIEGRTKSHYYTARTTMTYRAAIDDALAGKPFRPELRAMLEGLANRGYTDGFMVRHGHSTAQNYDYGSSSQDRRIFVGEIVADDAHTSRWVTVDVKNRFAIGDELELVAPAGLTRFRLDAMQDMAGKAQELAPGSGTRVRIPVPQSDCRFGLLARCLD